MKILKLIINALIFIIIVSCPLKLLPAKQIIINQTPIDLTIKFDLIQGGPEMVHVPAGRQAIKDLDTFCVQKITAALEDTGADFHDFPNIQKKFALANLSVEEYVQSNCGLITGGPSSPAEEQPGKGYEPDRKYTIALRPIDTNDNIADTANNYAMVTLPPTQQLREMYIIIQPLKPGEK